MGGIGQCEALLNGDLILVVRERHVERLVVGGMEVAFGDTGITVGGGTFQLLNGEFSLLWAVSRQLQRIKVVATLDGGLQFQNQGVALCTSGMLPRHRIGNLRHGKQRSRQGTE